MQIRRVILRGVRNFKDFDRSFEDSWTGRVPDALLLIGPNGSGKTTVLDAVADLWTLLEYHLHKDPVDLLFPPLRPLLLPHYFPGVAAIEVLGLDAETEPLWICTGLRDMCNTLLAEQSACHRVASLMVVPPTGERDFIYLPPHAMEKDHSASQAWRLHWSQRLNENILGKRSDLPNVVYLQSETRVLHAITEEFEVMREPKEFKWLARYEPTTSRKGSLQNYLYNLKVVDDPAFSDITRQINLFLVGKHLDGFDQRTGNLMVAVDGGGQHPIDQLSSGEKQVLLMLATITRWLQPGGIVLVDEPDLHLHVSLMTAFVSHLRRLVAEKKGQLILASHASALWRDFTESHLVRLGEINDQRIAVPLGEAVE